MLDQRTKGRGGHGRRHANGSAAAIARKALGAILLVVSLGLFAYPAVSSVVSSLGQSKVSTTVLSVADETNDERRLGYLAQAKKYNAELAMSSGYEWVDDSVGKGGNAGTTRDIVHVAGPGESTQETGRSTDSTVTTRILADGSKQIEVASSQEAKEFYDGLHADAMGKYPSILGSQGKSIAYDSQLSWGEGDAMGVVEIPSIGTRLVLRHGTGDGTLAVGAGHLEGSSLPVGGLSSHCVISGHSGMRDARMFDDLNLMHEGDVFLLYTLDDIYAYRIYLIEDMVDPEELPDHCRIEGGRDLCTLFTCTPYGVNSHRLLVHGERIPYDPDADELVWNMTRVYVNNMTRPLILAVAGMLLVWVVVMVVLLVRRR